MGPIPLLLFLAGALIVCLILLIVAFARTSRIRNLDLRLAGVEAALLRLMQQQAADQQLPVKAPPLPAQTPVTVVQPLTSDPAPVPPPFPNISPAHEHLELIIGRRWLGWIAILLILGATVFFLKYAFENRWIGELDRAG